MPPAKFTAKSFDAELAAVNAAAHLTLAEAEPILRKFLTHRSNLIVSRAAKHAAKLELKSLTPALAEAFQRFMEDPGKQDPQCWAKNEIAKALAALEYQDANLFLTGLKHHQYEPSYGGPSDSAGPLRGASALALVQCRELSSFVLLRHLTPLFTDSELPVRINAARAIEQIGSDASALLLRLRAELGPVPPDTESPELLGTCIGGTLRLDGESALPWAARFINTTPLDQTDLDISAEAAFVLAEHRSPAAVTHLIRAAETTSNPDLRDILFSALAAARIPEATAWLLQRIASGSLGARSAAKALCDSDPSEETAAQLKSLGHPCL
jgi:HEAT repeat protein